MAYKSETKVHEEQKWSNEQENLYSIEQKDLNFPCILLLQQEEKLEPYIGSVCKPESSHEPEAARNDQFARSFIGK
jgi:hypothetical protein